MHTLQAVFPIYGPGARALLAGGTLAVFVLANAVLQAVLNRAMRGREVHAGLRVLARQGLRVALWLIGLASALGTLGINVSALIAGLGLGGFALGFALRDILANLVAGVLILVYRPFQEGDDITVAGQSGSVSAIDLRYTELASAGKRVLVPNQTIFTSAVVVTPPSAAAPAEGSTAAP
ncbi:MAG TPA: mechanosensitive ion channel domain-containing protein [Trueperaceae bacterium]|nr:mechanosensitive ion channel domain-containing protein [Trueperaceae bacterium]